MNAIKAVDLALEKLEKIAIVLIFGCLIVVINVNILTRNLFLVSFEELFELAPVMVLWLSLLGASLALRSERHIKLEFLLRFCPNWVHPWALRITSLFGMVVMMILFWASISFFKEELMIFGAQGWVSLISPIFFGIMTFRYFIRFLATFRQPTNQKMPISS